MEIKGDYQRGGYAPIRGMVPRGDARETFADQAYDGTSGPRPVNFTFAEELSTS